MYGVVFLLAIILLIAFVFWQNEIKYSLPTEKPNAYTEVSFNQIIELPLGNEKLNSSNLFLHFFNPECPCSRFNINHYKSLLNKFGSKIVFAAIIPENVPIERARDFIPDSILVIQDVQSKIAQSCGVYSTPQAVIIDESKRLYFRGNYNKARYCTNKQTNYAEQALTTFLADSNLTNISPYASIAYGCQFYK